MIKKMIMRLVEYANEKNPKGNTLKQVILTLGKDGVYIFSTHGKGTFTHYLAREVDQKDIKSVVGAGDNFLAGYVFGMYHYQSEYNCVNFGQLCSELTLKSEKNVAPEINDKTLLIP